MIIKSDQAHGPCDSCPANQTATHGALAQGATGRFCEVLWLCKLCAIRMAQGEANILTAEEARDKVRAMDGATVDF